MQRILASLGVLAIFGVTFALPLYVALTLCAMPCCHHGGAGAGMTSGGMAGCATAPCSIRSDEATAPATTTSPVRATAAALVVVAHCGVRPSCPRTDSGGVAAALHIAVPSSVLRI
jgi:hypothetical protein